jgi:hypothetical protein
MQPRTESSSGLETRLAKTLLADLIDREANDYISIEIVREPSELAKTNRFKRKPNEDAHTTPFVRESSQSLRSMPVDERGTVQFVKYSAPYEKIELEEQPEPAPLAKEESAPFLQIDVWESGELVASTNLVAIDEIEPSDTLVDVEVEAIEATARPPGWFRPLIVIGLLAGAFAIGLGVPFLL